jgi:hypothetical protein
MKSTNPDESLDAEGPAEEAAVRVRDEDDV